MKICWKWVPPSLDDLLPTEIEALNPKDPLVVEARRMFYTLNPNPRKFEVVQNEQIPTEK